MISGKVQATPAADLEYVADIMGSAVKLQNEGHTTSACSTCQTTIGNNESELQLSVCYA